MDDKYSKNKKWDFLWILYRMKIMPWTEWKKIMLNNGVL
jgi:hypothetical protein